MGCKFSHATNDERELHKYIEQTIIRERKQLQQGKKIKLLLLGAGESGKSTIFRQMKIIHQNGFAQEERILYKDIIFSNVITAMKVLVDATLIFDISINPENGERAQRVSSFDNTGVPNIPQLFVEGLAEDVKVLWADPGIRAAYLRRSEIQLIDSAEYYFNSIDRLADPAYLPTEQDVLRSRVKTTGVVEIEFDYQHFTFKMVDVGGQRSERRKWIHCFQNCTAIIFVTSLSEYDQRCAEDSKRNRMWESLLLFEEICNSLWFKETSLLIFFNKVDLFKEKIKHTDLNVCFPDYDGGCNFENARLFITKKFESRNTMPESRGVYHYFTCATDTDNIKYVFECCKDIILHDDLKGTGLLV